MVAGGHSLAEIVGENGLGVDQLQSASLGQPHEADAPVVIGREAITQIIGSAAGQVGACIERLMANQHTIQEGTGGQLPGGTQATMTQKLPSLIHQVGLTVEYSRIACITLAPLGLRHSL